MSDYATQAVTEGRAQRDELAKPPPQPHARTTEDEARSLAKGLDLTTTRERCFYEDSWIETVVSWRAVADLIDRARKQPTQPAWRDAPTGPGLWVNSISGRVNVVIEETLSAWQDTGARWFGPISEDSGESHDPTV